MKCRTASDAEDLDGMAPVEWSLWRSQRKDKTLTITELPQYRGLLNDNKNG